MTGAGSGKLVLGHEQDFMGSLVDSDSDGTPDLFQAGRDDTIEDLEIDNQPVDLPKGDSVWDVNSREGNFAGTITISAAISADVHGDIEQLVFNDGGTGITSGLANSARVFVDADHLTGTANRELLGCVPQSYSIDWTQGEPVTYSLTLAFADENPDPSVGLTTATTASGGSTVMWSGGSLDIDGTTVEDMQSMSLSIEDIAELSYGASRFANHGVIRDPGTATLDVEAKFTSPSRLEFARGATDGIADTLEHRPATVTLETADATAVSTYNLESTSPATQSWENVLASDDTTDNTTLNVTGENAVSIA